MAKKVIYQVTRHKIQMVEVHNEQEEQAVILAKGQQFRQVGNAVPPMLAQVLALAIMEVLDEKNEV